MSSFYTRDELETIGFKHIGKNVKISRNTCIYGAEKMSIGDNSRIDDYCYLSGKITLGNHVHVSSFCALYGSTSGIVMKDFSTISTRGAIHASTDDYSGEHLTNPTVDEKYLGIKKAEVVIGRHVIIGSGSTILPGVNIGDGCSVGSMSLVNGSLDEWGIYVGIPCKKIKERKRDLLALEEVLLLEESEDTSLY